MPPPLLLFSDMHLSSRTADVAFEVLERVRAEAKQRGAAVGFLGDFFDEPHRTGSIDVHVMNRLRDYLSDVWDVDMIMIPGNHDATNTQANIHAIHTLPSFNSRIRVIDTPTVLNGDQLWFPWLRDPEENSAMLQAFKDSPARVVFGHFDIKGFRLARSHLSTVGVTLDTFLDSWKIYTGHYHQPQQTRNVRYLGSPYQLSASDAFCERALLVIDGSSYDVVETIPIAYGPRFFRVASEADVRTCLEHARVGDRVNIKRTFKPSQEQCQQLKDTAAAVLVEAPLACPESKLRIPDSEELTASKLFAEFARIRDIPHDQAYEEVQDWIQGYTPAHAAARGGAVVFHRIEISNFGPFFGTHSLSLTSGSFTLVQGDNESASFSNGSGKSMAFVGSLCWAFTGQLDTRGKVVFNDTQSISFNGLPYDVTVKVDGSLDGKAWTLQRTQAAGSASTSLSLYKEGQNMTQKHKTRTQNAVGPACLGEPLTRKELLTWLGERVLWSQHPMPLWIDASDAHAKGKLRSLAFVEIWDAAQSWNKKALKDAEASHIAASSSLGVESEHVEGVRRLRDSHAQNMKTWENNFAKRLQDATSQIERTEIQLAAVPDTTEQEMRLEQLKYELKARRRIHQDNMRKLCEEKYGFREPPRPCIPWTDKLQAEEKLLSGSVQELAVQYEELGNQQKDSARAVRSKRQQIQCCRRSRACGSCKRPFDGAADQEAQIRRLEQEIASATSQEETRKKEQNDLQGRIATVRARLDYLAACRQNNAIGIAEDRCTTTQNEVEEIQAQLDDLNAVRALLDKRRGLLDLLEQQKGQKRVLQQEVNPFTSQLEAEELRLARALQNQLKKRERLVSLAAEVQKHKSITPFFGSKGIQNYATERVLSQLQEATAKWLRQLCNDDGIDVRFTLNDDMSIGKQVLSGQKHGVMSGGEHKRLQLASFMGFRELGTSSCNLLILDEPCIFMDGEGIDSAKRCFAEWVGEAPDRTCFLISHDMSSTGFQNRLVVRRRNGRSQIVAPSKRRAPGGDDRAPTKKPQRLDIL